MRKSWFTCSAAGPRASIGIYDDIGGYGLTAKDFIADLKKLGPIADLTVSINSAGGSVFDGLAIYNALRSSGARVVTRIEGLAASIASVIAMAGDEVHMPASSFLMVHDPSSIVAGNAHDMSKMAETLRNVKRSLVGIYSKRTGLDEAEIEQLMEAETWMDGQQALAKGFATHLLSEPAIAAHLDLSKFHRVPDPVRALHQSATTEFPMTDSSTQTAPAADVQPTLKDRKTIIEDLVGPKTSSGNWHSPVQDEPAPKLSDRAEIEREARKLADERTKKIAAVYRAGRDLGLENEAQRLLDDGGVDISDIPEMLIEVFARRQQRSQRVGSMIPTGGVQVLVDHEDPKLVMDRMSDAITAQFVPGTKVPDAAREFMAHKPQDLMRNLLDRRGYDTRRMTRSEIVDAALHTTSDFPNLLGTSANKIFLGSYEAAPQTFRTVMGREDLPNFQQANLLRDGDFPTLAKVLESGEFTYGTMSESNEVAQLATYGRTFAISRHSLMNDSLGVFGRMVSKIGQAVARFENATAWTFVVANGNTSDGVAFFAEAAWDTGHNNYTSTGTALSATSIGLGRAKMRTQKSNDNNVINATPRYLVVPANIETVAEQILYPTTVVTSAASIATPSMRTLTLLVEPFLDGAGDNDAWYLFADPAQGAAFVYGYLEGDTAPRVRVNDPFNVDGVEFQVRMDFHVSAADPRFAYLNEGA